MTTTEPTTAHRVVIAGAVPEITAPAGIIDKAQEAMAILASVTEQLAKVDGLATEVQEAWHDCVLEMAPYHRGVDLEWVDVPAEGIGWTALWQALMSICYRYDANHYSHLGLEVDEIARGERNFPVGTVVTVDDRTGNPSAMEVIVVPGTRAEQPGHYTARKVDDPSKRFLFTHDEIKAGLARLSQH